jgi:uridine kinase
MDLAEEVFLHRIIDARRVVSVPRAVLAAVTGIDASGKGYFTARLARSLRTNGLRTATINIDAWLNLPAIRFSDANPAEHFYQRAIRFGPMFTDLVFPLRTRRSLRLEAPVAAETATGYRPYLYDFQDIDVILLEGIYLLKRQFQAYYDLSVWIECGFETALERAVARAQEGLTTERTVAAYKRIYFPAQEIHIARDDPKAAATLTVTNDPRLNVTENPA